LANDNFKRPPREILDIMSEIGEVYEGNDWLVVKKYILRYSHPSLRKRFSTRHIKTKKHIINEYEQSLIDKYYQLYNKKLVLDEEKRHKENYHKK
jgi:hypothetical protein